MDLQHMGRRKSAPQFCNSLKGMPPPHRVTRPNTAGIILAINNSNPIPIKSTLTKTIASANRRSTFRNHSNNIMLPRLNPSITPTSHPNILIRAKGEQNYTPHPGAHKCKCCC